VFEVGTATMMAAKGAIVPVAKVMADAKEKFDPKEYLPTVTGYYSDSKGNMLSYPFNSSTVVFYVNKDAFKKAGLDGEKGAETWKEFDAAAEKLKAAGRNASTPPAGRHGCTSRTSAPGTTCRSAPSRTAWAGIDTEFRINSPLHVRHVAMLGDMAKKGLFSLQRAGATRARRVSRAASAR
jgi:sn-glycerol 3-phosphate transport system substrate-binding protein